MSLLGLDVGTTGCKAVVFRPDGAVLATAYREYPLLNPGRTQYELDPDLVWQHLRSCIQEVNAQVHDEPVMALSISSQGEAVVPVSADRQVLANSPVSSDNRAVAQADELVSRLGFDRIYQLTGQPASALFSLPKILWWRTNAIVTLCLFMVALGMFPSIMVPMVETGVGYIMNLLGGA